MFTPKKPKDEMSNLMAYQPEKLKDEPRVQQRPQSAMKERNAETPTNLLRRPQSAVRDKFRLSQDQNGLIKLQRAKDTLDTTSEGSVISRPQNTANKELVRPTTASTIQTIQGEKESDEPTKQELYDL